MESLATFIKSPSRNHLVFSNGCLDYIEYMNVGLEVSSYIEDILNDRKLSMRAQDFLNTKLRTGICHSNDIGDYIALTNVGILFEPALKFDIEGLFNRWSQNITLIIDMGQGGVRDGRFYLVDNVSEDYSVSLGTINYIVLSEN